MEQGKTLQPHEIRVIKIGKRAILELTWEVLNKISYEKFRLPHGANSIKRISIDWCFDEDKCEMILFAHSSTDEINKDAAIAYINNLSGGAIESLLVNTKGKEYYQSIPGASFVVGCPNATRARICGCGLGNTWGTLCTMLDSRVQPLRKHEIRVIRLSQQAIQELLWEHFMKVGDNVMDIPNEERFGVIFHMHIEGKLEKLMLYAINLNEVSDSVFEEVDTYCRQHVCFTTDSFSKRPANGRHYVSVMLPKS